MDGAAWDNYTTEFGEPHYTAEFGEPPSYRTLEAVQKYAGVVYEVAKAQGVLFGDVYERMLNNGKGDWKNLFVDGLHLSESGAAVVFDVLFPIIDRILKSHPFLYPDWKTVDFQNPSLPR